MLINVVLFQVCWWACILGAAKGFSYLAVVLVILSFLFQSYRSENLKEELVFGLSATLLGSAFDSLGIYFDIFSFPNGSEVSWSYPLWMSALWLNFATLFSKSLKWMSGKYLLSAVLGFFGGPMSYYAGASFGAIALGENFYLSLVIIGLMWAIATPVMLYGSDRISKHTLKCA